MASRRNRDRVLDWSSFDNQFTYVHKDRNEELLASGDPKWLSIFEAQDEPTRIRIAEGKVSLEELEEQRKAISDEPRDVAVDDVVAASGNNLTPEEAGLVAEDEAITSRLDALRAQIGGTRDVMSANADFENLISLRKYETQEARDEARSRIYDTVRNRRLVGRGAGRIDPSLTAELAVIDEAEKVFTTPGEFDRRLQALGSERILGGQEAQRAEEYYNRTGNIGTRTIGDVVSNAESAFSIAGGVAGGLVGGPPGATVGAVAGSAPMAKVAYDAAFTEARLAGVPEDKARLFATAMSGSEFVIEAIAGKIGGGGAVSGVLKDSLKRFFPEIAGRVATKAAIGATVAGAAGYAEEFGTEALQQLGALGASGLVEDPNFRKFLRDQIARSKGGDIDYAQVLSDWNRAGLAGAGQGAPIGGIGGGLSAVAERSRNEQLALLNNTVGNEAAKARYAQIVANATAAADKLAQESTPSVPVQMELFGGESSPVSIPPSDTLVPVTPVVPLSLQKRAEALRAQTNEKQKKTEEAGWKALEEDKKKLESQKAKDTDVFMNTYMENNPQATSADVALAAETFQKGWKPQINSKAPRSAQETVKVKPSSRVPAKTITPPTPVQAVLEGTKPLPKPKGKKKKAKPTIVQADVLKKIEGLASDSKLKTILSKPPGVKTAGVIRQLAREGSSDSEGLVDLINKGKLGIVEKESDLPDGLEKGRDGWYDPVSKRVYLVAENLSPKTLRGTALHEVNHFLNRNKKDTKTKTKINQLISGNIEGYNNRIKALAKSGNKTAQAALKAAEATGNVEEELTSYFASYALDNITAKGPLGRAGQIYKDIKSAINTTARNKGIGTLSDNDISYILRRQVEDAPSVDFTDGDESLESVIGTKAKTYQDTVNKYPERAYKGARDNKPRIEISDRKAELQHGNISLIKNRIARGLEDRTDVTLKGLLKHEDLFNAYPETIKSELTSTVGGKLRTTPKELGPIKDIKIGINPNLASGEGSYSYENDDIEISSIDLNRPGVLKRILLHELQHAIQARENFEGGSNLKDVMKLLQQQHPDMSDKEVGEEAWKRYQRTYGEAEARLSEGNFNLTDEELSEQLPEKRMTELTWNPSTQRAEYKRIHPLQTRSGTRLVDRAQSTGKLPEGRSREAALTSLPAGLASIKAARGGNFDPFFLRGLVNDFSSGGHGASYSHRMLSNYLSRWAGIENDPLKDIELPNGLDWEALWDKALEPLTKDEVIAGLEDYARQERRQLGFGGVEWDESSPQETNRWVYDLYNELRNPNIPGDTPIWGAKSSMYSLGGLEEHVLSGAPYQASIKIGDYLSHVADYLLTVPEDKIKQYDLVRAVKETQAWDAENKRKAEKQRAISDSKLKTYIQFPDGYRWVRLDSPGQFAAESDMMGHSVRGYEPPPVPRNARNWLDFIRGKDESFFNQYLNKYPKISTLLEALKDEDKALLTGSFTPAAVRAIGTEGKLQTALEATPEYITSIKGEEGAGEGGHEYYGYGGWNAIKADNARIYSLRDPKGKSVVTVELGKDTLNDLGKELKLTPKFEVSQIKGRYNEAPDPSLHPKIQDLLLNLNEEELIATNDDEQHRDMNNAGLTEYYPITAFGGGPGDMFWVRPEDVRALEKKVRDYFAKEGKDADLIANIDEFYDELDKRSIKELPYFFSHSPTVNRVGSNGLASQSRLSSPDNSIWDTTGASLLKLLFDPNKGIGKRGLETRDYWRLKSGGLRDIAEGHAVRINASLVAHEQDPQAFEAAVDKAEGEPDALSRDRALDALVRNWGDAGREYRAGRMLIDQLSKEILKDWHAEITKTGRKASKAELKVMNAIVDNIGKYSTRVYLSNIPELGDSYAKELLKQYDKGDENNKYYQTVKNALDYLLEHEVGIAPKKDLYKRKTPTLRRTYQTWIGPADNLSKQEMIDALDAKRSEIGGAEMDKMLQKTVREMLGLDNKDNTSPIATYYRGGSVDKTILHQRERVPAPLRKLMGEVTDPAQKILTTVSAQADLMFKNRMLNDFYDNFEGKLWVRPGDRTKPGSEKFTEQLNGESYGPLDGVYVTKPFSYAIKAARVHTLDMKEALSMAGLDVWKPVEIAGAKIASGIGKLSTVQKMSKTALDQGAWALNAAGSPLALLKNGQIMGATKPSRQALVDAVTLALQAAGVEHKKNPETTKRLATLLEHGLPDSVFTAELRDSEKEFYQKLLKELNENTSLSPRKAWRAAAKGMRGLRDIYGLLDSWVKIADFHGQVEYLTDYYKANGDTVSEETIQREAADMVKFRNITYSRAPIAVQVLERSGATVFATFAAEVLRTMITTPYTIKMAVDKAREAKTPEARNIALGEATKVGVGYTAAVAMIPAITHMLLNQIFNGEDDEDKAKEERERFLKLWFETDRDQSYYVVGKNEAGGAVLFNASRADPHGHVTDFVRQAAQSDDPEEYWNSVKSLFTNSAGNGYMDDLINLVQDTGPKTSNLAESFPEAQNAFANAFEEVGGDRATADRVTRLIDNFVPGAARIFNTDKTRVVSGNSVDDATIANGMSALGMRMTVINPTEVAKFEAGQFNTARARAVTQWNEMMHRENLTEDDIARTALNIYTDEEEAMRRLVEVYSGLDTEIAGVNPRKTLADNNVSPEDINDAALGRYRSVVLSPARMNEQEKKQLGQIEDRDQRAILRNNYRLARQVLRELELETR
jgi:hypothetical protein